MPWNPDRYNQFKHIRYQPFYDLAAMISDDGLKSGLDIGCGTGEQTRILAEKFPRAKFLGIDPSTEMLANSNGLERENLRFDRFTVEAYLAAYPEQRWDLIFSNAALQWSDHHEQLLPALISRLADRGQLAIQMPMQKENLLNRLLTNLADQQPFSGYLNGWNRPSPMLSIDRYTQLMFAGGLTGLQVIQKVYPIVADHPDQLFDFISGSALIPYLERLSAAEQALFAAEYKRRIAEVFKEFPAVYPFKRLLLYGRKPR